MRIRLPWPRLPRETSTLLNRSLTLLQARFVAPSSNNSPTLQHGKRAFVTVTALQNSKRDQATDGLSQRKQGSTATNQSKSHNQTSTRTPSEQTDATESTADKVPDQYIRQLDLFLPSRLRLHDAPVTTEGSPSVSTLLDILFSARGYLSKHFEEPADLLSYLLIGHGRHNAVLHLIEILLQFAAAGKAASPQDVLPSNLDWATPYNTALSENCGPVNIDVVKKHSSKSSGTLHDRYHDQPNRKHEKAALTHVWRFLSTIVVRAAHSDRVEAQALLSVAHRALAKVHHLNLIPDNVYSYSHMHLSSTIKRPPILHLLSSRMLTALSDAVWRATQDEAISEAASSGIAYRKLGQDPPGGRFRLKVRDLGPEAWLELILWCCVEGGYPMIGVGIIKSMRRQIEDPWFAVSWTGSPDSQNPSGIDWDRVQNRSGGTVGRIEGYSSEAPLVDIPQRTISVEVVLALVESLLTLEELSSRKKSLSELFGTIRDLISFLEPHTLPPEYFDYLSLRMLQREDLDWAKKPSSLHEWSSNVEWLRNLESARAPLALSMDFRCWSIVGHSELRAGLLHQALQAYLHAGYPNEAVIVFNEIQQLVDNSKAQAISAFISSAPDPSARFFDARPNKRNPDFVDSHGQLPPHKVAAFLNMVTENKLIKLGDWMLYSDDIDGPVVPRSWYSCLSIATALVRYAGESSDHAVIERVVGDMRRRRTNAPVKYLQSLTDAYIRTFDVSRARACLSNLKQAVAGGYSPSNLAHLAGALLRLESSPLRSAGTSNASQTYQMQSLMHDILEGRYDGTKGTFYRSQITDFRQQIGHLLRVFDNITSPSLNEISAKYMALYPSGNAANLRSSTFDTILSAIVECKGAIEGRRVWDIFCNDPVSGAGSNELLIPMSAGLVKDLVDAGMQPKDDQILEPPQRAVSTKDSHDLALRNAKITFDADLSQSTWAPEQLIKSVLRDDNPNPAVSPSIKTLRIIAQGALLNQLDRQNKTWTRKRTEPSDVLSWVGPRFKAFGRAQPRKQELSMPYSVIEAKLEEDSVEEGTRVTGKERQKLDVTKFFTPVTITRVPSSSRNRAIP